MLLVLVGMVVSAGALWAVQAVLGDAPEPLPPQGALIYTVAEESVERSMPVIVVVDRAREPVAINLLDGMVTRIAELGMRVSSGDVVYEVAGVPVRAVEGTVPFYRDMGPGMNGDDIRQLQRVLIDLGYQTVEPDGVFRASTSAAVRAWRRDLGLPAGDRVTLGELIAIAGLPRILEVAEGIQVGRLVFTGADALVALEDEPMFELPVTEAQARTLEAVESLVVEYDGMEWSARVMASRNDPERGVIVLTLIGLDGGPVCGSSCHALPAGRIQLRGRAVMIPPTRGPAVPVAALRTEPNGDVWVWLEAGGQRTVNVLATVGGLSIVDGLEVGDRVVVGGGSDATENG